MVLSQLSRQNLRQRNLWESQISHSYPNGGTGCYQNPIKREDRGRGGRGESVAGNSYFETDQASEYHPVIRNHLNAQTAIPDYGVPVKRRTIRLYSQVKKVIIDA